MKGLEVILRPLIKIKQMAFGEREVPGFYRIKIVNRSGQVIWLAKNTIGDLHDIVPPGRSLEIRLPKEEKMEFYAYKASSDLSVSGLNYCDKRLFTHEDVWIIQ